ncbi:hypothetical protein AB1N83_010528 [Pleurotus pulmonarius]
MGEAMGGGCLMSLPHFLHSLIRYQRCTFIPRFPTPNSQPLSLRLCPSRPIKGRQVWQGEGVERGKYTHGSKASLSPRPRPYCPVRFEARRTMASENDSGPLRPTKLPIELIDQIIGFLKECTKGEQKDVGLLYGTNINWEYRDSLDACSLVCRAWNELCRPRIFSGFVMRMGSDETKPKVSFFQFTAPHLFKYIVELTIVFDHDFHGELEHWFADALPQFVNLRYLCIIDTGRSAVQKLLALGLPALLAGVPIEKFDACNLHFNADDLHLVLSIFSSTLRGLFLWECTSSSSNAAAIPSYSEGPPITSLPALRRLVLKPEKKATPRLPFNTLEVPRLSSLTCMYDEHFYDLSQWDSTSVSELTLQVNQNSNLPRFSPALRPSCLTIIIFQTQRQWAYLPVIRWIGRLLSRFAHLDDVVDLKITIGNSDHYPTGVFYPSHSDCDELRSTLRCFLSGEKQRRILINLNISGPLKLVEPPADTGEVTSRRLREAFEPMIGSGKLVLDVTIDEPIQ